MAIYVCSDIHGQKDLFDRMLEKIGFSDEDTLYINGDIIDRGPDSIGLLKKIIRMPNVISVLGNHELFMIDYLEGRPEGDYWVSSQNGGERTFIPFMDLTREEQKEIFLYLYDLYLQIEIKINEKVFLISHSSFIDEAGTIKWVALNDRERVFQTVWNSPWRFWEYRSLYDYKRDGRFHVIGHVPVQYISDNPDPGKAYLDLNSHVVNIDLGCAGMERYKGKEKDLALCCMDLTAFSSGRTEDAFIYCR